MKSFILTSLAAALVVPSLALAGSAANPASNVGRENFGFSFEMESQVKNVEDDQASSTRLLGKVTWGALECVDLYAKMGASDLKIEVPGLQDYEGKRGMTWGCGARAMLLETKRPTIGAFVDVQLLSFYTKGTVWRSIEEYGYVEKDVNRYKWNEVQASLVAVWQRPLFQPYIGFGLTNVFGHVTGDVYRVTGALEEFDSHRSHDFREDAIPEGIAGIDINLGGTGKLSAEIRYGEERDISFFVGASELWHVK
jgi:hypothetical protein